MQFPRKATTTGTLQRNIASSAPQTSTSWKWASLDMSNRNSGYSEISPPAQKWSPAPCTSTQLISSDWRRSNASFKPPHMLRDIALNLAGWLSWTVAIWPCNARSTVPTRCDALIALCGPCQTRAKAPHRPKSLARTTIAPYSCPGPANRGGHRAHGKIPQ